MKNILKMQTHKLQMNNSKSKKKRRKLVRNVISITQKEDIFYTEDKSKGIPNGIFNKKVSPGTLSEDSDWDPKKHKRLRKKGYS